MTKENRERAYKNFRDIENNYNALPHLNSGMTKTQTIRARAKRERRCLIIEKPRTRN